MNYKNIPVYRRGRQKCSTIRASLMLLRRYQDGHRLTGRERAIAKLIEERLTEREMEFLRYYYESGMTHPQIARYLHLCPSTVTKGILRAEKKFWAFADIIDDNS